MDSEKRQTFEKIAGMLVIGVPDVQIAEVMSLSAGRIAQIKQSDEFKPFLAEAATERLQEQAEINEGWDKVEREALKIVTDVLKYNKNPDYALKAAMVANRATRKGSVGNQPLPTAMGERVVIHLNANFVGKLQQLSIGKAEIGTSNLQDALAVSQSQQKKVNLLAPGQVKKLLLDEKENADIIDDIDFGTFEVA